MLSFDEYNELTEALITFGGQAYPKFGNVIIMAGGAGSGKGFVKNNLIGAEGFTFDVDAMKTLAMKSTKINQMVKTEFGVELDKLDLKNPNDVFKMHAIIGDELNLDDKKLQALYTSALTAAPDRKPNIIFDVTLKDIRKLQKITSAVKDIGYNPKNIHIVWVVNDVEVAKKLNQKRSRTVPVEILVNTHRGVAATMNDIVKMGKQINRYLDGDIVFAFNKIGIDSKLVSSSRGGSYVEDANYFYVKKAGQAPLSMDRIADSIKKKIQSYVPPEVSWD